MASIRKFEDLDIWQLARAQCNDFDSMAMESALSKDYELRNQMNASSGSVMDCIAEGFERLGNSEFKNFLVIAKGSNGEYRPQLYRCLDRKHITVQRFEELLAKNIVIGNKLMAFINYLQKTPCKGQRYKDTQGGSNINPQTSNNN